MFKVIWRIWAALCMYSFRAELLVNVVEWAVSADPIAFLPH